MAWRSGQAYGQDLRDRILSAQGSINAIAQTLAIRSFL